ncbi:MAG: GGDEF domain-containing protein [Henriciella sp.]|nr:GGDEF domain-containing protein [Henriciella sp.]
MGNRAKQTILRGFGITLLSVCLSAGFTSLWYEIDANVTRGDILLVATLIRMICAPLCTYIGMKSRLKMEALALENARIANTDALTGLFNRRAFFDKIEALSPPSNEPLGPVTYFVCDIDHFKHFNDQHGHATGDAVLTHVASLFRGALPQRALIARIGGEEFAIRLTHRSGQFDANVFANRLIDRVASEPLILEGHCHSVTLSVGLFVGDQHTPPAQALKAADQAMYAAKANGRNQFVQAA